MLARVSGTVGGVAGLASLALPYALVSSGTLGLDVQEEAYTLFGLAQLLADAGKDPTMVYVLVVVIVLGSAIALAGGLLQGPVAAFGGLVQLVAAGGFAYVATKEGSRSFLLGLGQMDLTLQVGVFVLAGAGVVSAASLPLGLLPDSSRTRSTST